MVKISYMNGDYLDHDKAKIHIEDRSNQFSDGVYEVIEIKQSTCLNFADHMTRLSRSLKELKIDFVNEPDKIKTIILELFAKNKLANGAVYIQISRGSAPRNHAFPEHAAPFITMTILDMKPPFLADYENGIKVITYPDMRWKRRDIKTVSLLANVLAKEEAARQGAAEAVLFEDDGMITEASSSNLFIIDEQNILRTHPLNNMILGGVTRKNILNVAAKLGIKYKEEAFSKDDLFKAKEVFITSTIRHVLPVTTIDEVVVGNGKIGPLTYKLRVAYEEFLNGQVY